MDVIRARGFDLIALPDLPGSAGAGHLDGGIARDRRWLGCDWLTDAAHSAAALDANGNFDWLVVDNYGVERQWECSLQQEGRRIMVIDDLADRAHDCDLLLDQNLGRVAADYAGKVPQACTLLIGPAFALIGPAFAQTRAQSLARRARGETGHLLVSMGGADPSNVTGRVLAALAGGSIAERWRIDVVMGHSAPALAQVLRCASSMPCPVEVHVGIGVDDMAALMARADLAIGAAGGTAWERCCLGLPSLLVVLAENQRAGAMALERTGAAVVVGEVDDFAPRLFEVMTRVAQPSTMACVSAAASAVVDGQGAGRVVRALAG
jgi:UDP-2,4-diacetamido-2,4,6-trideoxy-beta-L-altropyranose hydrolase